MPRHRNRAEQPRLRIRMFGSFEVWRGRRLLTLYDWRTRKARALFRILVHERGHAVPYERLVDLLWPDRPRGAAFNSLHTNMVYLRHALSGDAWVEHTSPYIRHNEIGYLFVRSSAWVDVDEFLDRLQAEATGRASTTGGAVRMWEEAVSLYSGDYVADELYEEWPRGTREWLREKYLSVLLRLGASYMSAGRHDKAADTARKIIEYDPYREQGFRLLMLVQYLRGEKAKALIAYKKLHDLLAQELGTQPARETRTMAQAIESDTLTPGAIPV